MRGRVHACSGSVFLSQHRVDLFGAVLSFSDLDQRPDDRAAHLVEKSSAFDDEGDSRSIALDPASGDGSHRIVERHAAVGGE